MSDTYKVRMTVLAMGATQSPEDAAEWARHLAEDAGLIVLQVEEPDLVPPRPSYGSAEEDVYPT